MSNDFHLRVRISETHRAILEKMAEQRGHAENLSDMTRFLIERAGQETAESVKLAPAIYKTVCDLAGELERTPEALLTDCVKGIAFMLDGNDEPPLLVKEIQLRRHYTNLTSPTRSTPSRAAKSLKIAS